MVDKNINNFINRKQQGLKNRIMNLIGRCVLAAVTDSKKMQEVKVTILEGETKDEIEHFQNYGFTSHAPKNSEGLAISLNGNRDHTVVINIDNREFRIKSLAEGEVAVYNKFGAKTVYKSDGSIEHTASNHKFNGPVDIQGVVTTSSTITAQDEITSVSAGTSLGGTKSVYNTHTHPGDSGGTTGSPDQTI